MTKILRVRLQCLQSKHVQGKVLQFFIQYFLCKESEEN